MELFNLDFSDGKNIGKSICWIMSYTSWLLLIITGFISLKWLSVKPNSEHGGYIVWTIKAVRNLPYKKDILINREQYYYPLQIHVSLIYIVFILTLIIILVGFILYIFKTIYKKDEKMKNGMMGDFSKFHFIPLLFVSTLFIIGESIDKDFDKPNHLKQMTYAGSIFSILGLISMIFIYIKTELNLEKWWQILLLKKGVYSCLIVLMWYYFCYDIFWIKYYENPDHPKIWENYAKKFSLSVSIIFGIGSFAFSFFCKDLVVSGMTALIYLGLTIYYFKIPLIFRKETILYKNGIGTVDIMMLVFSVSLVIFLLIEHKDRCLKS